MKKGWVETTLGGIGNVAMCKRIFKEETTATGDIPFYKIGTFGRKPDAYISSHTYSEYRAKYPFPKRGDVLISASGTIGRRVRYDGEPAYFQDSNIVWIDNDEKKVLNDYLYHFYGACEWNSTKGATISRLYNEDLRRIVIAFPESHQEQQRIVGALDDAFDGLARATANAEQNLRNARALFETHLQSVFTQRGKGWGEKQLEEVLAVQPQNGWSPPAANHADSGTPVLTLSSVTGFVFRPGKIKFTSAVTDSRARYWVQNGDLLITRSNTPELVGHVAIASGIQGPTIYPDLIMRMNPDPEQALTEFLYYQMRTPALRREISDRAQGANPTMKKISNGAVRTLPICVPPIPEQHRVIAQLDALASETQRLESIYRQKLAALNELKKSLLHQAFSGSL